ncbi:GNAT family N-acetyltransferase [Loktanella sp. Alg231-35]|uniref:GNAT family N-acetyltransferase n=1 Tax=Loktanella sp. Alg231-35 TaxID=1922220 RepID=UPI000D5510BC|nr:GNAT family N-acetyltransferase [Loktanella sp. Alg231-35]
MILTEGLHEVPAGQVAAVVTYLEMTAAARMPAKPMPNGFTATQEKMDVDSYRALFRAVGAPWLWTSRLTTEDNALRAILASVNTELWVIRDADQAIGFIELDFSAPAVCELAFFGLVKSATGHGLGGPLMAHAQDRAFSRGANVMTVHTCSLDDPRALAFYQRAGFTPIKRAVEVFADPRLDGPHNPDTAPQIPCLS